MAKTRGKQSCPHCGQSVNERNIALTKVMVKSLEKVLRWCDEKNIHEFKRRDAKHLFTSETESATFGNWVFFGGIFYKHGMGNWGLNKDRARAFLSGKLTITVAIWYNPLTKEITVDREGTVNQVPGIAAFLTEEGDFLAEYRGNVREYKDGQLF